MNIKDITDIRGTVVIKNQVPAGWTEIDSSRIDWPRDISSLQEAFGSSPYECKPENEYEDHKSEEHKSEEHKSEEHKKNGDVTAVRIIPMPLQSSVRTETDVTYIRLPSFDKVRNDPSLYAHASRVLHQESNPHNARTLVQKHGHRELWVNPPPIPLETDEIDGVFGLTYQRVPHPSYGKATIPAYDMIKTSVNIMRGCFGGCSFCSITEHEGRIIQSRSEESILAELEDMRDKVPGFTGQVSDLGGPTANMYRLNCKSQEIQSSCRRLSCVFPTICKNLETSHKHTTQLYRKARALPGIKKIAIASGLRYDLAVEDPEYIEELVTHHVGGYLKIAPEHTEKGTLDLMMKPGMGTYDAFKKMFEHYSKKAGKKQYLIPYFIAAHPGCEDEDMLNLALWLKKNKYRVDQVQTFYPSPMSLATAMYFSGRNPLKKVSYKSDKLYTPKDYGQRRLQKAILRYHDDKNWTFLRQALKDMNRADLIGQGDHQLIPAEEGRDDRRKNTRNSHTTKRGVGKSGAAGKNSRGFNEARSGQWDNRSPGKGSKPRSAVRDKR